MCIRDRGKGAALFEVVQHLPGGQIAGGGQQHGGAAQAPALLRLHQGGKDALLIVEGEAVDIGDEAAALAQHELHLLLPLRRGQKFSPLVGGNGVKPQRHLHKEQHKHDKERQKTP